MADFEKRSEREIWRGHVISLASASFIAPDGSAFERELVHHPGAVSIVPVIGDEAILVRQYRAAVDRTVLEIPAGKRDQDGESPEAVARRELAEEIGMQAGGLELLCSFYNSPGFSDELSWCFLASDLSELTGGGDAQGAEEQHMTIESVALDAVPRLLAAGELVDAKTIIGLLVARERLGAP